MTSTLVNKVEAGAGHSFDGFSVEGKLLCELGRSKGGVFQGHTSRGGFADLKDCEAEH